MKYLCLVCFDGKEIEKFTTAEWAELTKESMAYDREITASGHFIMAQALQSVDTATTVRNRHGKISTTDGPFAETKEQVAGFILIEADDLNEAIRIAGGIPLAKIGSVEVRPIMSLG
ncbi:YciI family protein [Devosia sp.]|uniref:YciI family protein n=1 Tax=Devosia sp. TaxID=1871048 RepID=UPI003263C30E